MKYFLLLIVVGFATAQDEYPEENFDLSEVLENDRLLQAYSKCLLETGPCTAEVKRLREVLPKTLETRCAKCTEKQKEGAKKVINEIKIKHPDIWDELAVKYDPEGKHREAFQEFLRS